MTAPVPDAASPRLGEIWAFQVDIAGRTAPSSMGPDLVLIVSNTRDNALLPQVSVLPISDAPATDLTVILGAADHYPGRTVDVTRMRSIPKRWLAPPAAGVLALSRKTMREVFAAEIQYLCPEPE